MLKEAPAFVFLVVKNPSTKNSDIFVGYFCPSKLRYASVHGARKKEEKI